MKDNSNKVRYTSLSYATGIFARFDTLLSYPRTRSIDLEKQSGAEKDASTNDTHHLERNFHTGSSAGRATAAAAAGASRASGLSRASSGGGLRSLTSEVGAITLKTRTSADIAGHVLLGVLGHSGQNSGADLPVLGLAGALRSLAVLAEAAGTGGVVSGSEGLLQALEVRVGLDVAVGVDLDKTITVGLDGVLVSKTTRVDTGHVCGVKSGDLAPITTVGDAAVLREEDRFAVVAVELDLLVPARLGEGRGIAPGVIIESEEVRALVIRATVEEQSLLLDVLGNIGGGVTDRNGTRGLVANEALHVTGDGLDVSGSAGVVALVDDLISGEEQEKVVVVVERLDRGKDRLKVDVVVRTVKSGIGLTVEGVIRSVGIESEVDTGVFEDLHTLIVVLGVVNGVDTDSVDSKILEVGNIALQSLDIEERVLSVSRTTCGVLRDAVLLRSVVQTNLADRQHLERRNAHRRRRKHCL